MRIRLEDLQELCIKALCLSGMSNEHARIVAEVLSETDGYGTFSHGTVNLHNYIRKMKTGGLDFQAIPEIIREGPAFTVFDAHHALGMISAVTAMRSAIEKAKILGISLATVKNSSHFGAAGYYANMAAKDGLVALLMSNVDPNMTCPGAKGKVIGNNPLAYAFPTSDAPSLFFDIAMSNVASLKVIQARKDGLKIPDTWIVDKDGLPTDDPSHYPEEGAMQPFAAHKGYGFAVFVELLTGILSDGASGVLGGIPSWLFELGKPNLVTHTFIVMDPAVLGDRETFLAGVDAIVQGLRSAPKAAGSDRIFTPGEMEWEHYFEALEYGLKLPEHVFGSLRAMSEELGLDLRLIPDEE